MKEENEAIIKALNIYGRVPETWELLNEIERLNNIINELEQYLIDGGVDDEILECCDIYAVNGVELRKYIEKLKEGK